MKKHIILIIASSIMVSLNAQQLKYKEVYAAMKTSKDFEYYQLLLRFQRQNPSHANTYYQIGLICQKWMRQYDPLLQAEIVEENINNAQLYLNLCLKYLDEKEARKNGNYYQGAVNELTDHNPEVDAIQKDIKDRLEDVKQFKKYHDQDVLFLVSSVTKYNECINIFNEINKQNSRLKELYFNVDSSLTKKLDALKLSFDSCIFYFKKLESSLSEYPLGNYSPQYSLVSIETYRLHGLTSSNFLLNKVTLWNFGEWVNSFNKILNTDIAEIYKNAYETDKLHSNYIAHLRLKRIENVPANYVLNPIVINKIGKYDFKSVVSDLFIYQESKIGYLRQYASPNYTIPDTVKSRIPQSKPDYYFQLINLKKRTDSILTNLKTSATPEAITKYSGFFNDRYKGYQGFNSYIEKQKLENDTLLKNSLESYKNEILKSYTPDTLAAKILTYKKTNVYLNILRPDLIKGEGYFTLCKSFKNAEQAIIAGTFAQKNSDGIPFVALIDSSKTIKWLKTYKVGQGGPQYGLQILLSADGIFLSVAWKSPKGIHNYLLSLDMDGNLKINKEIKVVSLPRLMTYDDVNQTIMIAYKGSDLVPFTSENDSLSIFMLDANANIKWSKNLLFNGYLSNILKINNLLYIFGSYNNLSAPDGKKYQIEENKSNSFFTTIDVDGNWQETKILPANFSYYPLKFVKINSDYFDFISLREVPVSNYLKSGNFVTTINPYYAIISAKGSLYFSY